MTSIQGGCRPVDPPGSPPTSHQTASMPFSPSVNARASDFAPGDLVLLTPLQFLVAWTAERRHALAEWHARKDEAVAAADVARVAYFQRMIEGEEAHLRICGSRLYQLGRDAEGPKGIAVGGTRRRWR